MKNYAIEIRLSLGSLETFYNLNVQAQSEDEAKEAALQSFIENMPFSIIGEKIEVYSVDGVVQS